MGITNLPKPGLNFKATLGPGSFQKKLSNATRYGDLKNLRDNQKTIIEGIKKYQRVIRIKGGLSRLQQRDAWLKMKASDKTITKEDRREIKQVLKHLGRGQASAEKKAEIIKFSDGKESHLTKEQIKRNLIRSQQERIDEPRIIGRGVPYSRQYAGGAVQSHGVTREAVVDKKEKGGKIGITAEYKNSLSLPVRGLLVRGTQADAQAGKLPDNSAPKTPLPGIKPLGL